MIENVKYLQQPAQVTLKSMALYSVVEVLLNSIKGKYVMSFFWTTLSRFSKYSVVAVILNLSSNFGIDSKE